MPAMTEEFSERDLAGARFRRVNLGRAAFELVTFAGAAFEQVTFAGARFRQVDLSGVRIRSAYLRDLDIGGEVERLLVNGIDVAPLIEAELDRRHPERTKLRPTDAAGFREAWDVIEQLWAGTVARARELDPALLHDRVDDEWSFIETLRHLVFATDAWVGRVVLGDPSPWDPLDLPWDEMPDIGGDPARPRGAARAGRSAGAPRPTAPRRCVVSSVISPTSNSPGLRCPCPSPAGQSRRAIRYARAWPRSSRRSGGIGSSPSATSPPSPNMREFPT